MGALFFIHILTRRKKEYANIKINEKKSERCTHTHRQTYDQHTDTNHLATHARRATPPSPTHAHGERRRGKENLWPHTLPRTESKTNLTRNYNEQIARPGLKSNSDTLDILYAWWGVKKK